MTHASGTGAKAQEEEKLRKEQQDELTEQLEETFPASDPPSMTQPKPHPDGPEKKPGAGVEAELERQRAARERKRT